MVSNSYPQFLSILRNFRLLQRRNRAVRSISSYKISLLESHLLTEVDVGRLITGKELARRLCVPKQEASRLAIKMVKQGLLRIKEATDGREKPFALTEQGEQIVKEITAKMVPLVTELFSPLKPSEFAQFQRCMSRISDAMDVPLTNPRENEPIIRVELRRITRALTLLKSKVFDSELHPTEWHILSELQAATDGLTVSDIAATLNLRTATVSASMKNLALCKLVKKKSSDIDKRSTIYKIADPGRGVLRGTEDRGVEIIKKGLSKSSIKELRSINMIFDKILAR